ncbi:MULTISPECIES: nitrogenase component 1 [unclassified Lebetimonas]|uniref:nitrogenase component 1 n=1 Tax=unclassified Lebetimonas TaxID=2648158 RepID=UPI0004659831|nr:MULTISPECIES: nitrogenase component 1 [unclassified Lebetimonas]
MKLIDNLLPLASGYFGVASALYELGGLMITYGPAGGAWHINIGDEYRWYRNKTKLVGAGLLEMDAVFGNDAKFIDRIINVAKNLKPKFLVLMGTPVSAIIGTDLNGLSETIQKELNIPLFYINTKGTETYSEGASRAFLELAKTVLKPQKKEEKTVNILGAVHLDIGHHTHLNPLINLLKNLNYKIISIWGMEKNFENLIESSKAALNIVITSSGLKLAEYMHKNFDIPYIVGFPVGETIKNLINKKSVNNKKVLIIHEPIIALSIKEYFEKNLGIEAFAASPIKNDLLNNNCCFFENKNFSFTETEEGFKKFNDEFYYIIADPIYQKFIKSKKFIPLPHLALSGRLYMNLNYDFIGKEGEIYFKKFL